jgi:phosphonate transport system substrate-binding protein
MPSLSRRLIVWTVPLMAVALLPACERRGPTQGPQYSAAAAVAGGPVYRLAVHPLHNPAKLSEAYQPLVDHLNQQLVGAHFELEAARDYASYEAKLRARGPDLLLPNPWQTLQAMNAGYHVIAMAGDAADFKGLFLALRDSPLRSPADLVGKAVAYPAPTALAACIMPQWFLHEHGVDVNRDIDNRYVGSQESAIQNALRGQVAVAATWPPPWRAFQKDHPAEAAKLRVIWETPPLLNNAFMVRDDLPAPLREHLRKVLLSLHTTPAGAALLANMETARFHPADDATYGPVRAFVARFERDVRPVERR